MRLGRPKVALILTEDERVRLTSLAHRSRTAAQLARRARIVLACAEGHHHTVVAKRVRVSPATVGKWRARFLRDRLDGLLDEPRPGAPRTVTDAHVERVVMVRLETTPPGATHWSTRSLATVTGLSRIRGVSVHVQWLPEGRIPGVAHHLRRRSPSGARVG